MTYYFTPYPYRMARRWALADDNRRDFSLPIDVREEDEAFVLNALVPGLKADDLNIRILDNAVSIEGEFKADENEYVLRELPHGSFSRTLRLSSALDAEKAEAKITNGVLTLHLPKSETARPKIIKVAAK
jgi:HSP20 family protein